MRPLAVTVDSYDDIDRSYGKKFYISLLPKKFSDSFSFLYLSRRLLIDNLLNYETSGEYGHIRTGSDG